jgi:hypothetical protein
MAPWLEAKLSLLAPLQCHMIWINLALGQKFHD